MKKSLLLSLTWITLVALTATTLYAQTATGTSLVDKMKAAVHAFTLAGNLNPGQTGMESSPIVGKKTGNMLTAGEWNRVLELVSEGSGNWSQVASIFCRKNSADISTVVVLGANLIWVKFTAADCGGVLPDSSYYGALGTLLVCNGALDPIVFNADSTNGPWVGFSSRGGSVCTWSDGKKYDISVVYTKSASGVASTSPPSSIISYNGSFVDLSNNNNTTQSKDTGISATTYPNAVVMLRGSSSSGSNRDRFELTTRISAGKWFVDVIPRDGGFPDQALDVFFSLMAW